MKDSIFVLLSSVVGVVILTTTAIARPDHSMVVVDVNVDQVSMTKQMSGPTADKLEDLDLTPEQEEEIAAIQAGLAEEIAEILTPEQLMALEDAQANGDSMRSVMMSLDRSQRSAVMDVMRSAQDEIMAVLTPEQHAQIEGESPRDRN